MIVQRPMVPLVFVRQWIIHRAKARIKSVRKRRPLPPRPLPRVVGGHIKIFSRKTLKGILG